MSKIDITPIIRSHFGTLVDYSTHRLSVSDLIVFFGVPLALSVLALYVKWSCSVDALNALLAAFAIFAGLLLNLLLLVYTFSADSFQQNALEKVRVQFVRELHNNIAYSVLVSIVIVVVSLVAVTHIKMADDAASATPKVSGHTGPYSTFALVYLTANFMLTLLMVLKRIHTMMNERLERPAIRKAS
jgi:hypothetical protein